MAKFEIGRAIEGALAVAAGTQAGRVAGREHRQRWDLQNQSLLLQQQQQGLQQRQFERALVNDEDDQTFRYQNLLLSILDPSSPQHGQVGREVARRGGITLPEAQGMPTGGFGDGAGFVPPATQEIGPDGDVLPGVPAAPAMGASPWRNPREDDAFASIRQQAAALFEEARAAGDEGGSRGISALMTRISQRPQGYTSSQAQQDLDRLMVGLQARGTARSLTVSLGNAVKDLESLGRRGAFTSPEIALEGRKLIGEGRSIDTSTPEGVAQVQDWLKRYQIFSGQGIEGPDDNDRYRTEQLKRQGDADDDRLRLRATDANKALVGQILAAIESGAGPKDLLDIIKQQHAHARRFEQFGLEPYGGAEFSDTPRQVGHQLRSSPVDLSPSGRINALNQGLSGAPQDLPAEQAVETLRPETPEEILARQLEAAAGRFQDGPVQRRYVQSAVNSLRNILTGPRWETLSEEEKEQVIGRLNSLGAKLGQGLGELLPKGFRADQMPKRLVEQQRQRRAELDERIRHNQQQEQLARERIVKIGQKAAAQGKPGSLTDVEKQRLRDNSQEVGRLLAEVNQIRGKPFPSESEEARIKAVIGEDGKSGAVGALRAESDRLLKAAEGRLREPMGPPAALKGGSPRADYEAQLRAGAGGRLSEQQIQAFVKRRFPGN